MADVTTACRDITELMPLAQKACNLFMTKCKAAGYDIFITETYRSQVRQDYLYSQGRTRPGNKVTWTKNSRHTSRRAWDIATNGGNLYDKAVLQKCGEIAKKLGITWGGTWSTPDTPHFEISTSWKEPKEDIDMEELKALQEKVGYIDETVTRLHSTVSCIDDSLTNLYASVNALIDRVDKLTKTYDTIDEAPLWYRESVEKLVKSGAIRGDENGRLGLTEDLLKTLTILDRVGVI